MEKPKNCVIVIFGASGDLTKRKLIPALFALSQQEMMPQKYVILGVGRTDLSDDEFRNKMADSLRKYSDKKPMEESEYDEFVKSLYFQQLNTELGEEYQKLRVRLTELNTIADAHENYLYYLATPPALYPLVPVFLAQQKLNLQPTNLAKKKLIIEKPFGYDLDSAKELNIRLLKTFQEEQIYRIDHYLGKETAQNILVTRFSNGIFEPLWNRNYIDHVEITSVEGIGVEDRGGYYDGSGALRDMVQNHLLQLMGLVAMEPPASNDSNAIRNETLKVFQSLRPIDESEVDKFVIRGQYTNSKIRGEKVNGYREEKGVAPESRTETFVAMKFFIDNWRWGGVPFYIRTGKRMPTRVTEIVIHFKKTPHHLFNRTGYSNLENNILVIRIQPDEGILLKLGTKVPGQGFNVQSVNMDFHYSDLTNVYVPGAYERLLYDCMMGDSTLYTRGDALEACWKFVAPIQKAWKDNPNIKVYGYPAGSWGPENMDDLLEDRSSQWRYPCKNLTDDGIFCEL